MTRRFPASRGERRPSGEEALLDLDALVASIRADVVRGSVEVARAAAQALRRVATEAPADSAGGLRWTLGEVCLGLLDAQPAMAPLVALSREVLSAAETADPLEEARRRAAGAAEEFFRASLGARAQRAGVLAAAQLPREGAVLTLSSSSTVRAALLAAGRERGLRVVCLESRPMGEGRELAAALAAEGVGVLFAVDAALESLIGECSAVLLGADSVGDRGIVNKIGSVAAAEAAARARVPVIVAADTTKLLPPGFPQPVSDDRGPEEVWPAPTGVRVWNRYFERVDARLVGLVVTEEGAAPPDRLAAQRARLAVPPLLREWAAARS